MHLRRLVLASSLVAVLALGVAASAQASRLGVNEDDFSLQWTDLVLTPDVGSAVTCDVTLEGSFHSTTVIKSNGLLIGHVHHTSVASCSGGSATVLTGTLPWHLAYQGFSGTLPNMETITADVVGLSLSVQPSGSSACLFRTDQSEPLRLVLDNKAGLVERAAPSEAAAIDIDTTGFVCELAGDVSASGTALAAAETAEELVIWLIEGALGELEVDPEVPVIEREDADRTIEIELANRARAGAGHIKIRRIVLRPRTPDNEFFDMPTDGCTGALLVAHKAGDCLVAVRYRGRDEALPKNAVLQIEYRNGGEPLVTDELVIQAWR